MGESRFIRILAGATAAVMLLFTGNSLFRGTRAVQPEETTEPEVIAVTTEAPTRPPETTAPPEPTVAVFVQELETAMADMDGAHIFVYDLTAGEMLACKTEDSEALYPASITKLYALWLALQYLEPETVVTAGEELSLVRPGSSLAYIARGCWVTVEMLAEAMLLPSGNDAAYVLAAAAGRVIAGDETLGGIAAVEAFVAEMNRRGTELGMVNSHFENPDGYHLESHYSCPRDVALIGALAMESEIIRRYAVMEADTVKYVSGETITWYNTNRLVNPREREYRADALGLKTGFTTEAGYCLLAAFGEGDQQVLVGIFGAAQNLTRYENAAALWQCCGGGS